MAKTNHHYERKLHELMELAQHYRTAGRYYLRTGLGLSLAGVGILAGLFSQQIPTLIAALMAVAGLALLFRRRG